MQPDRPRILVVDTDVAANELAANLLALFNYKVVAVRSAAEAIVEARRAEFDAMLISIELPGGGFGLAQAIRELPGYEDVPVAFTTISEYDSALLMEAQFYNGLFLHRKPYSEAELLAQLSTMVRIEQLQDELKARMAELNLLASTDPLTGLYNRRLLFKRMEEELARAVRRSLPICVLYLDIDLFKQINDTYGHHAGDAVLQQLAGIMTSLLRKSDIVGRIGGEEFLILLPETDKDAGLRIAERLRKRVANTAFRIGPECIEMTVSLGVHFDPDPASVTADQIVRLADAALYSAKQAGRNRVVYLGSETVPRSSPPEGQ
jgi:diguanylate cyclase (GGDEF)-like protein